MSAGLGGDQRPWIPVMFSADELRELSELEQSGCCGGRGCGCGGGGDGGDEATDRPKFGKRIANKFKSSE
jgi:hypothetical protein